MQWAQAETPGWSTQRNAANYNRAGVIKQDTLETVRRTGNLAGAVGWFEYDLDVPEAGWYELVLQGYGKEIEFFIDPQSGAENPSRAYVAGSLGYNGSDDKIGNFWLSKGRHVLRIQRYFWTGFPQVRGFVLTKADKRLATTVRVTRSPANSVYRKGGCGSIDIQYGPRAASILPAHLVNASSSVVLSSYSITLPATPKVSVMSRPLPCDRPGFFVLYFGDDEKGITNRDIHQVDYEVIATESALPAGTTLRKTLVQTIDCVSILPAYQSGETRVIAGSAGAYRESGDVGWIDSSHSKLDWRKPSWFAYVLDKVEPQRPYMVEVDYPDDAERTFAIALREASPLSYPVAGGVDSGGEFVLSNRMQTHTLLYWPRANATRLVFLPAHNGQGAAAARIRVYRIDDALPPLMGAVKNGRSYANWYEEGSNFLSMYGAPNENPDGIVTALERWAQTVSYIGGDTLWPTVAIYSFALYPSRYHLLFSRPWEMDTLRATLLVAEKYGLKVVPELHPRADELAWAHPAAEKSHPELLLSKDGRAQKDLPPFYNPLYPNNQRWYLEMITELAQRYKDAPAFTGISLRFMQWKNPALHNFHSLDWGYDDYTVGLFERETGITLPTSAGAGRFATRYQWLTTRYRQQWLAWRCEKIAALVTRIRDKVRAVRSDLTIYIPVFPMTEAGSRYNTDTQWLQEAGLDSRLLSKIDGVVLVNALHGYGRRGDAATNALLRNNLMNPAQQQVFSDSGPTARFLPYANYFEATESVAPPQELGFPANTKNTWMSAVINPAGRNYLERFAVLLAETDAALLGDGGNAYTIGQPQLREFLREYRNLPVVPFKRRTAAGAPVAVWEATLPEGLYFYLVNRTSTISEVQVNFDRNNELVRLSTGERVPLIKNILRMRLQPYQLLVYRVPASTRISAAGVP